MLWIGPAANVPSMSRPQQATERTAFMTALETLLADRTEIGDGELHRALRDLQRKYFKPPR